MVAEPQHAESTGGFPAGRDQQDMWKPSEITGYAVAFILIALELAGKGITYVGADDVRFETDGTGIAGSAITKLRNAHIITDYWETHADAGVFHGRRRSKKESANGRKVGLYRLASHGIAVTFLKRHNVSIVSRQGELKL